MRCTSIIVACLLPCASLLLSGCMSQGTTVDHQNLGTIHPGLSTRAEVERTFGKPDAVNTVAEDHVLIYSHIHVQPNIWAWIPIADIFLAGADYDRQSFQVILNSRDVVESYQVAEYKGGSSGGVMNDYVKESPTTAPTP